MKCKDIKYLIPEFIEDKLSYEERLIVSSHLDNCTNCFAEYTQIESLYGRLKDGTTFQPPQQYWNNIIPLIHQRIGNHSRKLFVNLYTKVSIPTAAAILILLIVIRFYSGSTKDNEHPSNRNTELSNMVNELATKNVDSMTAEEISLVDFVELKDNDQSDRYVIKKILKEQKNVVESDYVGVESALQVMDDNEIIKLITYLDQAKN
jgi:hypothetical protein